MTAATAARDGCRLRRLPETAAGADPGRAGSASRRTSRTRSRSWSARAPASSPARSSTSPAAPAADGASRPARPPASWIVDGYRCDSDGDASTIADDDQVGHVDHRPVAEGGVDLVRRRVRLVGEQADPRALGLDPAGNLGDGVAGPAAAALGWRRVHRAERATPNDGGFAPVRCTGSPVSSTQNHSRAGSDRRSISARSGMSCALAPRGRPACSSASPMNAREPLRDQIQVVLGRGHQARRARGPARQLTELVQPGVLGDLDSAAAEPGQLGGAQLDGGQGPVDREHLLPALVQGAGQGHRGLVGHRQQERRVRRERSPSASRLRPRHRTRP